MPRYRRLLALCVFVVLLSLCLLALRKDRLKGSSLLSGSVTLPNHTMVSFSNVGRTGGYDGDEVSHWYRGSACNNLSEEFVGSLPLFAPCQPDIPQGPAVWGRFPYLGPIDYIQSSKNPCWFTESRFYCLPYFFLIGVSKSGTSDLFARISLHHSIYKSKKERHWFDRLRYQRFQPFFKYLALFKGLARHVANDLETKGHSKYIGGDGTPSYFFDNNQWPLYSGNEGCTEPRVILAHHLRYLNPDVKIILIFRHPVSRLYSRYLFDHGQPSTRQKDPPSPLRFHTYVADALVKYRQCFQRWSIRHCVYNKTLYLSTRKLRIQENMYDVLLEDWLRIVPRDQILLLRFKDYVRDVKAVLEQVFSFLEVDALNDTQMEEIAIRKIENAGKYYKVGVMLPKTERMLQHFYRPFVRRFAAMTEDTRFLWRD